METMILLPLDFIESFTPTLNGNQTYLKFYLEGSILLLIVIFRRGVDQIIFIGLWTLSYHQKDNLMTQCCYNIPVVRSTSSMLKKCRQIEELNAECVELRKKIEVSRTQLRATNCTLRDITNENQHLKRKCELSKVKIDKLKDKNEQLETERAMLEIEDLDLQSEEESDTSFQTTDAESTFQDIIGHHKYTPEIRKLLQLVG